MRSQAEIKSLIANLETDLNRSKSITGLMHISDTGQDIKEIKSFLNDLRSLLDDPSYKPKMTEVKGWVEKKSWSILTNF